MIGLRREEPHTKKDVLNAMNGADALNVENELTVSDKLIAELGAQATRQSRGMGGTLETAGQVVGACLSAEILQSK